MSLPSPAGVAPRAAQRPPAAARAASQALAWRPAPAGAAAAAAAAARRAPPPRATVRLDVGGETHSLDVPDGDNVLAVALDAGLPVPHDCRMGVCMNCAARLLEGSVDQSAGMLSEDVLAKGYVLLCCAVPEGEGVRVAVIPEEELMDEVMMR